MTSLQEANRVIAMVVEMNLTIDEVAKKLILTNSKNPDYIDGINDLKRSLSEHISEWEDTQLSNI